MGMGKVRQWDRVRFDGGCLGGFARLEDIIFEVAVGWVWKEGGRGGRDVWFAFFFDWDGLGGWV